VRVRASQAKSRRSPVPLPASTVAALYATARPAVLPEAPCWKPRPQLDDAEEDLKAAGSRRDPAGVVDATRSRVPTGRCLAPGRRLPRQAQKLMRPLDPTLTRTCT